jgi:hypothetical protein
LFSFPADFASGKKLFSRRSDYSAYAIVPVGAIATANGDFSVSAAISLEQASNRHDSKRERIVYPSLRTESTMPRRILWAVIILLASRVPAQGQQTIRFPEAAPTAPNTPVAQLNFEEAQQATGLSEAALTAPATPAAQPRFDAGTCDDRGSQRIWVGAEYLLWWINRGPINSPLVTTGSLTDIPPGALGQPGTRVLFGDQPFDYGALSGFRVSGGIDLGNGFALESNYLWLQRGSDRFQTGSDASGNPLLTRPFFSNQFNLEDAFGVSVSSPLFGPYAGNINISSHSHLQGGELNLATCTPTSGCRNFVAFGGFRVMSLNEGLHIGEDLVPLAAGVVTFPGATVNVGDTISTLDRFHASNLFYGGQLGGRVLWRQGPWTVSLQGKIALGVTQEVVTIDGSSTLSSASGTTTVPGGVLALSSNNGRYFRNAFSVIPEANLKLGYDITPRVRATVGYTFLYWSDVARPGNQIDRNLNSGLIPTSQLFGNGLGGNRPAFQFHGSGYWAQGLDVGLEFKF